MYIKTFESFGKGRYLYHTPHIVYLNAILKKNKLISQHTYANACTRNFDCVSLTRDPNLFYDEQPFQFKLNRTKLNRDYELESYIDPIFGGADLEKEEIIKKDIYPLHKYIKSIQFNPQMNYEKGDIEMVYDTLSEYVKKHDITFELIEGGSISNKTVEDLKNFKY